jgi:peroxiredoxin
VARLPRKLLAAGDAAPDFALDDLSGATHTLAQILQRGAALLAVYKIGCPTCQLTLPFLDRVHRSGGLQVIGVSQDNAGGTQRFQTNYRIALPSLLDREEDNYRVSNAFGVSHVPSLFLIERDGRISLASEGFVKSELEAIGKRASMDLFGAADNVPQWKAG